MVHRYGDGTNSTVGTQFEQFLWRKKSLIDAEKKMVFSRLSKTENMPKHYGKTIKSYHYIPLLDDRNINDQGIDASGASYVGGNLYGSSRDIGLIQDRIPALTEDGGRVNRVGFTRLDLEAKITEIGFFYEWTKDSVQFDTDEMLMEHVMREGTRGAVEISEDLLQIDLINAAGVVIYAGAVTDDSEMTGEAGAVEPCIVDFNDLANLSVILDDNETPMETTILKGDTLTDTVTLDSCRIMYIGSAMENHLRFMTDPHGNPAFIPVNKYANQTTLIPGEIGTIHTFRVVRVQKMLQWNGKGAVATNLNDGYRATGGRYNIYPMLVVGDESFVTIGFQSDGVSEKFKTITKMPGEATASIDHDPFGKRGFHSIAWWYGTLILRNERIALIKTLAKI